jgi:hypothetical protein
VLRFPPAESERECLCDFIFADPIAAAGALEANDSTLVLK